MFFIPWTHVFVTGSAVAVGLHESGSVRSFAWRPVYIGQVVPKESLCTWFDASKFCAAKSLFQHQCFRIITWISFYLLTYFCKTPCNMCLSAILLGHFVRNLTDYRCDACISESFAPWFDGSCSMDLIHSFSRIPQQPSIFPIIFIHVPIMSIDFP